MDKTVEAEREIIRRKPEQFRKSSLHQMRFTPDEHEQFKVQAWARGLELSEYFRLLAREDFIELRRRDLVKKDETGWLYRHEENTAWQSFKPNKLDRS